MVRGRLICAGECGRRLVPVSVWRTWPRETRRTSKATHARASSRGLCVGCHQRHRLAGTLIDFERVNRTTEEFLEEYEILGPRGEGLTTEQIAARLDLSYEHVRQTLIRLRERGLI